VLGVVAFYRALLATTFDETQARMLGMRPRIADAVLLGLLAISIVASFEAVGNLLVFAFLVAPPATGVLLVKRVPRIIATAITVGAAAVVVGLLISYHHNTAASATMALASVTIFLAVLALCSARQAMRTISMASSPTR